MDLERFQDDVYEITERLASQLKKDDLPKLNFVRQRLIEMYKQNLVKINHSVLELICATNLIAHGYSVDVEKQVSDILICDVYATKGDGTTIIEIETGFTPPEHALDTVDYYIARIMRLQERMIVEKPGGGNYVGSWQYDRFVATLDGPAKDVILRQLNYTNKMWEDAKISMRQVLENGGTWQDAMQIFVDGAALSREQMDALTKITNSTDTTTDQVNGTLPFDFLDSIKNENATKEESQQFDVNGTAIKTGLKGTIIRLNVNGTIIELLVNGTTITPITNSTKN